LCQKKRERTILSISLYYGELDVGPKLPIDIRMRLDVAIGAAELDLALNRTKCSSLDGLDFVIGKSPLMPNQYSLYLCPLALNTEV
jgi:hypothetical protein